MSNKQTQDWLLSMEEEFYTANNRKKQVQILETLREYGFDGYADDFAKDLICDMCNKVDCTCDQQYEEAVDRELTW